MKKILKLTLLVAFFILSAAFVFASDYVKNPVDCPTTYSGQSCAPDDVCGVTGGIAQCYDTSLISIPSTYSSSYQTQVSTSLAAGYVLDCESYDGSVPHCDTWKCDRNTTCYSTQFRATNCTSTTSAPCGDCRSGYNDCDGDGLICEILDGASCTIAGLPGTYSGCSGSSGNCVMDKDYFETGVEINYSSTVPLLWGVQYGLGFLLNLTGVNKSVSFAINNSGCIIFPDGSTKCEAAWSRTGDNISSLNSSWNVGIGTSSPEGKFHVTNSDAVLYQENATSYNCSQNWNATQPCTNVNDSSWSTYGVAPDNGGSDLTVSFYANYTKPAWATDRSKWQVKDGAGTANLSLNIECWEQDPLQFRALSIYRTGFPVLGTWGGSWSCWDGTAWQSLSSGNSGTREVAELYEEAMYWEEADFTITEDGRVGIGTTNPNVKFQVISESIGSATLGNEYNTATGKYSVAIGQNSSAKGTGSLAVGVKSEAYYTSIAAGSNSNASGSYSVAMGQVAIASGAGSVAMGSSSKATGSPSVAIGYSLVAEGQASTAFGYTTNASGDYSTAMGYQSKASGSDGAIAVGYASRATGNAATAMGYGAYAEGIFGATAIGRNANASGQTSTAIGYQTKAKGRYAIAMGAFTTAKGDTATAMGRYPIAYADQSFAWGGDSCTYGGSDCNITYSGVFAIYGGLCVDNASEPGGCPDVGDGDIVADGTITASAFDIAERINSIQQLEPGDTVIIDINNNEQIIRSTKPYDPLVAGIISTEPGNILGLENTGNSLLALAGRVPVKVCLENGPIQLGDRLTTSSTQGHAMKWSLNDISEASDFEELKQILYENELRRNAILGKALEAFDGSEYDYLNENREPCGKIITLVTLQ